MISEWHLEIFCNIINEWDFFSNLIYVFWLKVLISYKKNLTGPKLLNSSVTNKYINKWTWINDKKGRTLIQFR